VIESEPADPPRPGRPWWAPLLGTGSLGLGGLQFLTGLLLLALALSGPSSAAGPIAMLGLAWLLPGFLLGAGGIGIVIGAPWARRVSLAAAIVGIAFLGGVGAARQSIPPAVADEGEWALHHPEAPPLARDLWKRAGRDSDALAILRDPSQANTIGWTYSAYCCCPVLPWYLVVLLVCALPAGKRIAKG